MLKLSKSDDSPTYCYTKEEVVAIVEYCREHDDSLWLGQVCLALACTGLRISELAALRPADVDFEHNIIHITNDPDSGPAKKALRRRTKNRCDRSFPISPELRPVLEQMPQSRDELMFHGPLGGRLKSDTVRNRLVQTVLPAVAKAFQNRGMATQIEKGRLHSFRHYFCSECASHIPDMLMVMNWLGHKDSKMVRHYYHLRDSRAQTEMKKINFTRPDEAA